MRYNYIFWDFNGTIIDDVNNALGCVNDLLYRKGRKPITLEEYYRYVETPIIGFYRHILPPKELDFDEISRDFHKDYAKRLNETGLATGVKELMAELKSRGAKQYIITSNHIDETTALCEKFGIIDYVEEISGATDSSCSSKTQRALELFERLNTDCRNAVFIGDTLHDLETANALGVDCVLVEYGHQGKRLLREHKAYTVPTLKEVKDIIFDTSCIDFHTHSTCSDGTMTPTELVQHAKEKGLYAIALTDHDNTDGLAEASAEAERLGIRLVPGIEFSAAMGTETHIIGLFIDRENEELKAAISKIKLDRVNRMKDICRKLQALGFDITYNEALTLGGSSFVGRAHIAQLMVKKGYCESVRDCFNKYIGLGKTAYSHAKRLTAVEAIKAINSAGGVAFLAHLNQTGLNLQETEKLLIELKNAGLTGIEGYYPEYTPKQTAQYRALAEKLGLAVSGGSDFHGTVKPHIEIGFGTGNIAIPTYIYKNLEAIKNTRTRFKTE